MGRQWGDHSEQLLSQEKWYQSASRVVGEKIPREVPVLTLQSVPAQSPGSGHMTSRLLVCTLGTRAAPRTAVKVREKLQQVLPDRKSVV